MALAFTRPTFGLLAALAFAPLLFALEGARTPGQAAGLGFLAGAIANGLCCVWLVGTISIFGGFPLLLALPIYAALVAWTAIPFAAFGALVSWAGVNPPVLLAPLLWTAIEAFFPNLFPWRLGYTQRALPVLIQSAEWVGPTLLTFTLVWLGTATARLKRRPLGILPPLALLALLAVHGRWRIAEIDQEISRAPRLQIGVVQGNIKLDEKRHVDLFESNIDRYRKLSLALTPTPDLLIWPETVVEWGLPHGATSLSAGLDPFPDAPAPLLFGALTFQPGATQSRWYNSILLRDAGGRIVGDYDKIVLMPFGEFLPFADAFPWLRSLSPMTGDFVRGTEMRPLRLNDKARLGVVVCYEDMLPDLFADASAQGANLLASLTNDAWYGDSSALQLHETLAFFRAVENRRFLVRSTNTGLTSVIDPVGRVQATLPPWQATASSIEVALLDLPTPYRAFDRPVRILLLVSAAALLLWCRSTSRRQRG